MRLIDADALIADIDKGLWGKDWDKALAKAIIKDAPTVVEFKDPITSVYVSRLEDEPQTERNE